jgi:predicted DNA-binding transcriptional regulator AlpA
MNNRRRKVRARALCERYGVVERTIYRWVAAGILPEPMWINGIRFWDDDEIEQRDRDRPRQQRRTVQTDAPQAENAEAAAR